MKCIQRALLLNALVAPALMAAPASDLLAIRVGRAETVSDGVIEHAVILVADGKISVVGQDLEIERGIPVIDRPDWVAMPGLVNAYSRIGMESRGKSASEPHLRASTELYARQHVWEDVLEAGITTLGLYPPGTGIPGRAVAIRPAGETKEEMILREDAYLKGLLRAQSSSKKMFRSGFEAADKYVEEEQKAREKYEKEREKLEKKKKKKSKSKKDDDKDKKGDDDKKAAAADDEEEELGPYVAPEPEPEAASFIELRDGSLRALIGIRKAADYLHWLDVIDGEDGVQWDLRVPLRRECDLFEVTDSLVEKGCRVVLDPELTWRPTTRRDRNLPAELAAAGVPVVLIPDSDGIDGQREWLHDVGNIVKFGMDRDAALRAITLEPAGLLGLEERIGSLEAGKDANLLLFDGDPLQPSTNLRAVMLEGRFVSGEENL